MRTMNVILKISGRAGLRPVHFIAAAVLLVAGCVTAQEQSGRHNNAGYDYYTAQMYPHATAEFKKALELDPGNAEAHNNIGNVYMKQRKFIDAAREYKKAIELDCKNATARNNLGSVYFELDMPRMAVKVFKAAVKADPDNKTFQKNLGLAQRKLGNFDEAVAAFKKAIETDPEYGKAYRGLGAALRFGNRKLAKGRHVFAGRRERLQLPRTRIPQARARRGSGNGI